MPKKKTSIYKYNDEEKSKLLKSRFNIWNAFKGLVCQINSAAWVTDPPGVGRDSGCGRADTHKIQFLNSALCFCVLTLNKTALISPQTQPCGFWTQRLTKTTCSRGQKQHVTKCWYVMSRCENGLEPIINQGLPKQIE